MTDRIPRSWKMAAGGLLPREFFGRPAVEVAPGLLGCVLRSRSADGDVAVRLVEVEAYAGLADPASHAFRGLTARNAVMFGPPGHAYVYFTYGMHFCVNLVCQPPGEPSAVLLRAGQVIEGTGLAAARRSVRRLPGAGSLPDRDLARGPARLCQALGIDRSLDGTDVCAPGSRLVICPPAAALPAAALPAAALPAAALPAAARISAGPRVGVTSAADVQWRFWLAGEPFVSEYRPAQRRARARRVSGPGPADGTMHR